MSWSVAALVYGFVLLATIIFGASIGSALGLAGIIGITLLAGTTFWPTIGDIVWNTANSFTLTAIPMFILMGELLLQGGVSRRFYNGLSTLLYGVKGGLAQSNIVCCGVFAAISGSSTATALTIGTVALPEMRSRGYDDRITFGTLTGGGCLGILIPPSIPMVIYATVVQESLIDLFMAGLMPGIFLALMFMVWVRISIAIRPDSVPERTGRPSARELLTGIRDCAPIMLLIFSVLGGMYFGIVTPTEAAGLGCLIAILICLAYRQLNMQKLKTALQNAMLTSAVVMFIIINSQILSYAMAVSGVGHSASQALISLGLGPFTFLVCLFFLYIILGMFIDGISMMLLTLPLLYPTISAYGFDGVLFGVMVVVFIELGQMTPPMGMNLFAIQSISGGETLSKIAKSSLPYSLIIASLIFILYFFPQLALWLPSAVK